MGKNSRRRGAKSQGGQAGCMWGLINLFNFRRAQANNRLVAGRKLAGRSSFSAKVLEDQHLLMSAMTEDSVAKPMGEKSFARRFEEDDRHTEVECNLCNSETVDGRWRNSRRTTRRRWKSCDAHVDAKSTAECFHVEAMQKRAARSLDFNDAEVFGAEKQTSEGAEMQSEKNTEWSEKKLPKIAILKPPVSVLRSRVVEGSFYPSPEARLAMRRNRGAREKVASYLLINELKRILQKKKRNKEKPHSKDHFFVERFFRPSKSASTKRTVGCEDTDFREQKLNVIYEKAKKHLSELMSVEAEHRPLHEEHFPKKTLATFISGEVNEEQEARAEGSIGDHPEDSAVFALSETGAPEIMCSGSSEADDSETPEAVVSGNTESLDNLACTPERPSPVSVLEADFLEEEIASSCEIPVEPLRIEFEEMEIREQIDDRLLDDFLGFVLQSAEVDWEGYCLKPYSLDQPLDPSITEKEFGGLRYSEKKLLVDCINEAITEKWNRYLIRSSVKPIPRTKSAMRDVREEVRWHLRPVPPPRSLDQLVHKDLSKPGLWMDLQENVNFLAAEIGENIFCDLIDDATVIPGEELLTL